MVDFFSLLQQPRRPWLELAALKAKYLELSGRFHPDRLAQAELAQLQTATLQTAELNQAHETLRDPKKRLQHLLALETGSDPREIQRVPPELSELLIEAGQLMKRVDGFLASRSGVESPLLRLQHFEQSMTWTEQVQALQEKIRLHTDRLDAALRELNPAWEALDTVDNPARRQTELPLARLEESYRRISLLKRSAQQLQDRLVQLAA